MKGFFYGQTEYNFLNNAVSLNDYINKAKEYNYSFLTITDPNLHGYYKFYLKCSELGIKPIIGLKIPLINNDSILAYALNDDGLTSLFKLNLVIEEKKELDINSLVNFNNLFFITPDNESLLYNYIINNDSIKIEEYLNSLNKLNFYLGINVFSKSFHSIIPFIKNNPNLKTLPVQRLDYLNKDDLIVYNTLRKIGGSSETDSLNYLKDLNELSLFDNYINTNITELVNSINYLNLNHKVDLPLYDKDLNSKETLFKLTNKGLEKRLSNSNKLNQINIYKERLNSELKVISKMNFDDYFLIVYDVIKWAKQNDILVGPGRGSAAGSLVAYCLGITEVDPLQYHLFFERFLNESRITMPDIDIDFPDNKRDKVIQYVKEKYSLNHVSYISAFSTFKAKSAIRDICRVNKIDIKHFNVVSQYLENHSIEETINKYHDFEEIVKVLSIALKMNGLVRHVSTHAAGIIISSVDLTLNLPLSNGLNGVYQSQLEAKELEGLGYLKIDFLGLRNLALIDEIIKKIPNFKLSQINYFDNKTYDDLKKGSTLGIFQLESTGITNVLKKLQPSNFNDIVSVLALYRPGPMDNIDEFINRKHSNNVTYLIRELEPILKDTYGIIVFQEQIMQIARAIASYSLAEADILRRAVSKKDEETLKKNREIFVTKALNNGFSNDVSDQIYDLIVKFALYGFNKSHSVAYAMISYQMAYLKTNYPLEFLSVMFDNVSSDKKELKRYIQYAKSIGIDVVTPKINHSESKTVIINKRLLLSFNTLNKFGSNAVNELLIEREKAKFSSFTDLKDRLIPEKLSIDNLKTLVNASCLDEFKLTKKEMSTEVTLDPIFAKYSTPNIQTEEYDNSVLRENEIEALGFAYNYDLFNLKKDQLSKLQYSKEDEFKLNGFYNVVGYFLEIKEIKTKNNELMAFVKIDLNFRVYDGVIFPNDYNKNNNLNTNDLYFINVSIQKRNDEIQLVCKNINII